MYKICDNFSHTLLLKQVRMGEPVSVIVFEMEACEIFISIFVEI